MCVCVCVCMYVYIYIYVCVCVYTHTHTHRVELGYDVMKGTAYFVSLEPSFAITEGYSVMVNSEELIGTTEYLTL